MDNGEVIAGLDEEWTLGGAKLMEWCAGFMMFIVCAELLFNNWGQAMPQLMLIWIGTTFGMASVRRQFPDEERGVRNKVMVTLGVEPPGIPAPSTLQPFWSGCPTRKLNEKCEYMTLRLDRVFVWEDAEDHQEEKLPGS